MTDGSSVSALGGALLSATRRGDLTAVADLLRQGAAPSVEDAGGDTPLHVAAESGHAELVLRLPEAGADPIQGDDAGNR